jgi:3-dehydroquinate dehydratase I
MRPKIVGVIASADDLKLALGMGEPPDLFELRLDCLCRMLSRLEREIPKLRRPVIITARDPREGGANNLSVEQRAELLLRFLPHAKYIDIELRSAARFKSLLARARKNRVRVILSFHDFKSIPTARTLRNKAARAKAHGAEIFKVATRTDTPAAIARLVDFLTGKDVDLLISAMGVGRLGIISRLLLATCGSVLNYGSLFKPQLEGQISIELLRSALRR